MAYFGSFTLADCRAWMSWIVTVGAQDGVPDLAKRGMAQLKASLRIKMADLTEIERLAQEHANNMALAAARA